MQIAEINGALNALHALGEAALLLGGGALLLLVCFAARGAATRRDA